MHQFQASTKMFFRQKLKCKGNISLLVILVLLSSSLISLLAMSQIKNLMTYGNTTYNYFKAHYIAKAGLELAITEVYTRDAGFDAQVQTGDSIVQQNFDKPENTGRDPYFSGTIKGKFPLLTNDIRNAECWNNEIKLEQWESRVIPLFYDNPAPNHTAYLTAESEKVVLDKSQIEKIHLSPIAPNGLIYGFFVFSGENFQEMLGMVSQEATNLSSFFGKKEVTELIQIQNNPQKTIRKYLTIVNTTQNPTKFCIKSESTPIASPDTLINIQSHYGGTEVGLQAIYSKPFPSFLQGISNFTSETSS